MVTFSWPWIFLLSPLPLIVMFRRAKKQSEAIKVTPRLRKALANTESTHGVKRYGRLLALWLGWFSLLFAIAQPMLPGDATAQPASGRTLALAIDLSASMERKDFYIDNEPVDRLTVVKKIAGEFISSRTGDRVGLILFGQRAFLGSPPSFDLTAVTHELDNSNIGMAGRTTAIGDALGMAIQSLRSDPAAEKAIILLSDGTNNSGSAEPESAARLARELAIRIHTIGLGSETGAREQDQAFFTSAAADLDESTLRAIADTSSGTFFRARTTSDLNDIYNTINQLEGSESLAPPVVVNQDIRNGFILILLLTMALHSALSFRLKRSA